MNEPVAWIDKDTLDATHIIKAVVRREQDEQHTIPLYTHPAKELLAKDILDVYQSRDWYEDFDGELWFNWIKFADAILRKAQEK